MYIKHINSTCTCKLACEPSIEIVVQYIKKTICWYNIKSLTFIALFTKMAYVYICHDTFIAQKYRSFIKWI